MINKLEIENFKCFREKTSFSLSAINLLSGINGRGKSTLLQVILLMRQSITHNDTINKILLNGECVSLGGFDDIKNIGRTKKDPITFTFHSDNFSIEYKLTEDPNDDMVAMINSINISSPLSNEDLNLYRKSGQLVYNSIEQSNDRKDSPRIALLNRLVPRAQFLFTGRERFPNLPKLNREISFSRTHYVGADRLGPQDFYYKYSLSRFPNVGPKGELTASVLQNKKSESVYKELCIQQNENSDPIEVLDAQTEAWISYIFDGGKVEIRPTDGSNTLIAAFNADSSSKPRFKPINVGFGFSYIMPIIVSGLIAKSNEMLIVENPEAHLHPKAQSRLVEFLCKVSKVGVQVLVESHSEHILNSLRVCVKDEIINSEDTSILYFHGKEKREIDSIPINSDGSIEKWPADFFDQTDKDLDKLFGV